MTRGQPSAVAAIRRAVDSERPPHALLLVGPARVGKTTLALDLAAGLLCSAPDPARRPCRECVACRKVEHGNHPDVHRLAPEGAGGQVRLGRIQELQSALSLMSMEGRFRVAIVEQADRLNPDAQNAFLKTLEEPPPGVSIVLAAEDESPLLPTVRSRCVRVRLGPVAVAEIGRLLADRGLADPARGAALARLAGGAPGLAIAFAQEPESVLVHARVVRTLLDLADADRRTRLGAAAELVADAMVLVDAAEPDGVDGDGPDRPAAGRQLPRGAPAERRRAVLALLSAWRPLARDLALAANGGTRQLVHLDLLEEISDAGARLDRRAIVDFLSLLDELAAAIEAYANAELALDVLLLAWPRPVAAGSAA